MIIERVEMDNFGPYLGHQGLELGLGEHPLIVIHGQNMSGKTSIINAIRWALYGVAKDRAGKAIPTRDLINSEAFKAGQRFVSVRLTIRDDSGTDSARYELRRQRQVRRGVTDPRLDGDFEEHVDIAHDGVVLSPVTFDEVVGSLLPEGISRFFLFDGELLNEYEELVRDGGERAAQAVKQAIEMILGLPAARLGREDIRALKEEASRKLQREARKDRQARDAGEELERLTAQKDRQEEDLRDLQARLRDTQRELRELDESIKQYEESREDAGRREELQAQLTNLEQQRVLLRDQRRGLVKDLWRDILAPRLATDLRRLEQERVRREQAVHQMVTAQREMQQLSKSIESGTCDHCGQALPEVSRAKVRAEIAELSAKVEALSHDADQERLQELAGITRQLRAIAPAGKIDAIKLVEQQLDKVNLDAFRAEQNIKAVDERLRNINTAEMLEWDREQKRLDAFRGEISASIRKVEAELDATRAEIEKQERIALQNESPVFQRLKVELQTLENLEAVFAKAVDKLRDELRLEVQERASEIFKSLTTDETYHGLSINEHYGLTILNQDGDPVPQRSAGAEQIVALSLLGAINSLATKKGPVVMDTPFGRLDRGHRANILRYVPTMAQQVVLLVHDGEVDRSRDLRDIRDQIDAEYRIEHPASGISQLVKEPVMANA